MKFLFGAEDALPLITEGWEKRYLSLDGKGYRFCAEVLPLGAIYWLSGRSEEIDAPAVETPLTQEALMGLVSNTYAIEFPDLAMSAKDLRLYSRLLRHVPVRRVFVPADPGHLADVCRIIIEDFGHV